MSNKRVIYDSDNFNALVTEIDEHISKIKDCFNKKMVFNSYKGSKAEEMEGSLNNVVLSLQKNMEDIEHIDLLLKYYKARYEDCVSTYKTSVGGE